MWVVKLLLLLVTGRGGARGGRTGVDGVCSPGDGGDFTVVGWVVSSTPGVETVAVWLHLTVPLSVLMM